MPQPATLKTAEIFSSVQGEGLRQGEPAIFIRFTGCNLRCSFCDTKTAWKPGADMTVEGIVQRVRAARRGFPAGWVCLTGGEPLLQDLGPLVRRLKKEKLRVQVETNGTMARDWPVDWWTVSPKPPAWKTADFFRNKAREVKLVVTRELTLKTIQKLRLEFPQKTPIILQPQSNKRWSAAHAFRLLERAVKTGLANIRLSVQLHKVFCLK